MRATILPNAIILAKAPRAAVGTASEVFLIFTTRVYSYLCNYPAILFIS